MRNCAFIWCGLLGLSLASSTAVAQESQPAPVEDSSAGSLNGACYGNGTCNAGLSCVDDVCAAPAVGGEGGACYGNGTCNQGLRCDASTKTCAASSTRATPTGESSPSVGTAPTGIAGSCYGCTGSITGSVQVGLLFPGSAFVEILDDSVDTDAGFLAHVGADYHVAPKFTVGAFVLYAASSSEGEDFTVTTIGATIKAIFTFEKFVLRPGVAFGYQLVSVRSEDSKGFDIGALVELVYPLNDKLGFAAQLSFISQPAGGSDNTDLTFAPILFATAGLGYLF